MDQGFRTHPKHVFRGEESSARHGLHLPRPRAEFPRPQRPQPRHRTHTDQTRKIRSVISQFLSFLGRKWGGCDSDLSVMVKMVMYRSRDGNELRKEVVKGKVDARSSDFPCIEFMYIKSYKNSRLNSALISELISP